MNRFFTGTFFKFFTVFMIIIVIALGILFISASQAPAPQDQIAQPAA